MEIKQFGQMRRKEGRKEGEEEGPPTLLGK
jgi:hypothetical protein